jgi:hypothetical protein
LGQDLIIHPSGQQRAAGHEEEAIYEGNQRIPNGWRIAGAKRSNP